MWKNLTLTTTLVFCGLVSSVTAQVGPGKGPTDYNYGNGRTAIGGENAYAQVCTRERNGRLSFRQGPGRQYGKIKEVPNGHTLALLGGGYSNDGFWWWKSAHNGNVGWVRADYVCGDPQ